MLNVKNKKSPTYRHKQGKRKNKHLYSNNVASQRQRILKLFEEEKRPLSTFDFRDKGILHPGGRIMELRKAGHKILTTFVREPDSNDVIHRIALYGYCGCGEVNHG